MVSFLLLPSEIREKIYKTLQTTTPRHEHQSRRDHFDRPIPAGILGTSKQIRAEAEPVLLLNNTYHYHLEQTTFCKTYSSPATEQHLATVLAMCPSLTSLHLHLILPRDAHISDPVGQDISGLIARMGRTTNLLLKHPNLHLQKVLLSAQKPPPADPTPIGLDTHGASFASGLCLLREKYKEVLAPLHSLPATVAIVFGAEKPNMNGLRASTAKGYAAMCEYILYQRIDKMFTSRAVVVGSTTPEAQAVANSRAVEEVKGGAELEELETKEEAEAPEPKHEPKTEPPSTGTSPAGYAVTPSRPQPQDKKMTKAEEEIPALEAGI